MLRAAELPVAAAVARELGALVNHHDGAGAVKCLPARKHGGREEAVRPLLDAAARLAGFAHGCRIALLLLEGLFDALAQLLVAAVVLNRKQPVDGVLVQEVHQRGPCVERVGVEDDLPVLQPDALQHLGEGVRLLVLLLNRGVVLDGAGVAVKERDALHALLVPAGLAPAVRGHQLLAVAPYGPHEAAFLRRVLRQFWIGPCGTPQSACGKSPRRHPRAPS